MATQADKIKALQDEVARLTAVVEALAGGPVLTQNRQRGAAGLNCPGEPGTDPALGGGMLKHSIPWNIYPKVAADGTQGPAAWLAHNWGDPVVTGFPEGNFINHAGSYDNPQPLPITACVGNLCWITWLQGPQSAGWNSGANISGMINAQGTGVDIVIATTHGLWTFASNGTLTHLIDGEAVNG